MPTSKYNTVDELPDLKQKVISVDSGTKKATTYNSVDELPIVKKKVGVGDNGIESEKPSQEEINSLWNAGKGNDVKTALENFKYEKPAIPNSNLGIDVGMQPVDVQAMKEQEKKTLKQAAINTTQQYFKNNKNLLRELSKTNDKLLEKDAEGKPIEDKFSEKEIEKTSAFQKKLSEIQKGLDKGDLAITHFQNGDKAGQPVLTRSAGFFESLGNSIKDSFLSTKDAIVSMTKNPKELADYYDEQRRNLPEVPVSTPTGIGSMVGGALGGLIKPVGEFALGEAIQPEGGGLVTAAMDIIPTSTSEKTKELYYERMGALENQYGKGKVPEELRLDAIHKAQNLAPIQAIPNEAMQLYLFGKGGNLANEAAIQSFKKTITKAGGDVAKMAALGGTSELATQGIKEVQTGDGKFDENVSEAAGQWALMEGIFKALPVANSVLGSKHITASAKNVMATLDPEIVQKLSEESVQKGWLTQEQADNAVKDIQDFAAIKKTIPENVPEDKAASITGLIQKNKNLEAEKKEIPTIFHDDIDAEIKNNEQKAKDILNSDKPLQHETDNLTGERGMSIGGRPKKEETQETEIPASQYNEASNSSDGRVSSNEKSTTEKRDGEIIQPQQTSEVTPEPTLSNKDNSVEHAQNIKGKFREQFKAKGNSDEHIDAAIALMDARAKSWASEEKGRTPEQWYQQIADVKSGEFEASDIQYQKGGLKAVVAGVLSTLHPIEIKENVSKITAPEFKTEIKTTPSEIEIKDNRTIDAISGNKLSDTKRLSTKTDSQTVKDIINSSIEHKIDPYTMLAIAMNESGISSEEGNPMHAFDETGHVITSGSHAEDLQLLDTVMKKFADKMKIADNLNKKSEADRIQAYNGYGKVGSHTEGEHKSYYGIDVSKEPIDMNKNPVYGKRIIDIRDNIIKKNPELVKLVESEKSNTVFSGIKDYNTKLTPDENTKYEAWKSKLPKELQNDYDYDLKGLWKENSNQQPSENMHFPDKYKKPNHYTFSDESKYSNNTQQGGQWKEVSGKWTFRASDFNLTQHSKADLLDYFKKYEPDSKLILPDKENISYQQQGGVKRGALETLKDGKVVIHALNSPDISTMTHEIFHVFEKDLTDAEKSQVKDFGGSEAFARAGEKYLRDGKAPTQELQPLFYKFKQWLTNIYQSLKGSPITKKISPEIKQIFDRLLTEKEQPIKDNSVVEGKQPKETAQPNEYQSKLKEIEDKHKQELHEAGKPVIEIGKISNRDIAKLDNPEKIKSVRKAHNEIQKRKQMLDALVNCL